MRTLLFLPIFILGLVAVAPFLTGCDGSDPAVESRLREAALVVVASPDSAIALLETVPGSDLRGEQRARHALEMAEAVWIKDGHLYDDSLITVAADYYEGRGDSLDIKSQFLKGVSLYDRREYGRALVSLTETYDRALSEGHRYYAAMCARTLGWVYHMLMIVDKNYEWTKRSYDMFVELGMPVNAAWRQMDLADALIFRDRYVDAESVLNGIDTTIISMDYRLNCQIAKSRLIIWNENDLFDKVENQIEYLKELDCMDLTAWEALANMYYQRGEYSRAEEALDSVLSYSSFPSDTMFYEYLVAAVERGRGNYKEACEKAFDWGVSVLTQTNRSIAYPEYLLLNDYLYLIAKTKGNELKQTYLSISLAIIVIILLIILMAYLNIIRSNNYKGYIKEKEERKRIKKQIDLLIADIEVKNQFANNLQNNIIQHLRNKYAVLNQLCTIWYMNNGTKANSDKFRTDIIKLLEELKKETTLAEIEMIIDENALGWMSEFRHLLPDLSNFQYRLAIYLYLDFNITSISILTNNKIESLYVHRSKLRKRILELDSEVANRLLKELHLMNQSSNKASTSDSDVSAEEK